MTFTQIPPNPELDALASAMRKRVADELLPELLLRPGNVQMSEYRAAIDRALESLAAELLSRMYQMGDFNFAPEVEADGDTTRITFRIPPEFL